MPDNAEHAGRTPDDTGWSLPPADATLEEAPSVVQEAEPPIHLDAISQRLLAAPLAVYRLAMGVVFREDTPHVVLVRMERDHPESVSVLLHLVHDAGRWLVAEGDPVVTGGAVTGYAPTNMGAAINEDGTVDVVKAWEAWPSTAAEMLSVALTRLRTHEPFAFLAWQDSVLTVAGL